MAAPAVRRASTADLDVVATAHLRIDLTARTVWRDGEEVRLTPTEWGLLNALVDLPFALSPVVIGLSLFLVYGATSLIGAFLEGLGIRVIFAMPGMVLATCFVALPLVLREVVPVLQEIGMEQEQAARSLGANSVQTFRRITLPAIKWAVLYGVVLSLARALGEFGAVKVVSGNVAGRTRTATLVVEEKYLNFDQQGAYATAFLLAMVSVACIVIVAIIRPKSHR